MGLLLATIDPTPTLSYYALLSGLVIALAGACVWLVVARHRKLPLVLSVAAVVAVSIAIGTSGAMLVRVLTLTLVGWAIVGLRPARADSRWARHRAARAAGEPDLAFWLPAVFIAGTALTPLALVGVLWLLNA